MSDYGRYGDTGYASRGRERDRERAFGRDYDKDRGFDRDRERGGFFGGDRDEDRNRGGFFGAGRNEDREDRGIFGRSRDRDQDRGERGGFFGRDRDRERGGSRSSAYGRRSRYGADWDRDERYYGYDDYHEGLAIDETGRLIASNKVEGTPVYGRDGDRLGSIYNFMVDKRSGQVEYAVMSYGGFLGMGQRYYPLPWRILTYDTREGGYHIDMRERDLENAPSFDRDDEPRFSRDYGRRVDNWYGVNRGRDR